MPEKLDTKQAKKTPSIVTSTRWNAVGRGGVAGLQILTTLVAFKLLTIEAVGLMAMARLVTGLAEKLQEMGSQHAIVQREELDSSFLNGAFVVNCCVGFVLTLGVIGVAPLLAIFYERSELVDVLRSLSLIFLIAPFGQVHRALLIRRMAFERIAAVDILMATTKGAVTIYMAWRGFDVWALVGGELAAICVATLALWVTSPWLPGVRTTHADLADVARFGSNLVGFSLSTYLFLNADRLIIGRVLGAEALGLYAFAQRVTLFPTQNISGVMLGVLIPSFSRMQDEPEEVRDRYLRAIAGISLITFPLLAAFACIAPMVLEIYDPRWSGAALIIALLAPVGMVQSITSTVGAIFISKGRPDLLFKLSIFVGAMTMTGYLLGSRWGLVGITSGYAVALLLCAYPTFAVTFRLIGERFSNLLRVLRPIAGATALAVFVLLATEAALQGAGIELRLIITAATGAIAYWGAIWVLRPGVLADVRRLLKI